MERLRKYSSLFMMSTEFTEGDMELMVQEGVIKKQSREICLSECKVTSAGAEIIANSLNHENILQEIRRYRNRVGDDGVHYLAKALLNNINTVQLLDLRGNGITNVGAKHLAEMLKTNDTLTTLYLSYNNIGHEGAQILANILQYYNKTLTVFDISSNYLTDSSVDYFIQLIKHSPTLNHLGVSDCNFSQSEQDRLQKAQKRKENFTVFV